MLCGNEIGTLGYFWVGNFSWISKSIAIYESFTLQMFTKNIKSL